MSDSIYALWWIVLAVVIFLVVPIVLYLLNRTLVSAKNIRDYTAEILASAQGLARNLIDVSELDRTPELARRVRDAASAFVAEAADLERRAGDRS